MLHGIRGTHQTGSQNHDVQAFMGFFTNQINNIPSQIDFFFPFLTVIDIFHSNITSMSANDLKPFIDLRFLIIRENQIASLDGDLLKYSRGLERVAFPDNLITSVGANFLSGMNKLKHVYFNRNICINMNSEIPEKIEDSVGNLLVE